MFFSLLQRKKISYKQQVSKTFVSFKPLKKDSGEFYSSNNAHWEVCQYADHVYLETYFHELTEIFTLHERTHV